MERLWKAFLNSVRAWRRLIGSETAFKQEIALLVLALPVGWLLAADARAYMALIVAILFLIVVEILNTGIEATCDAITTEFDARIQLAKDCGSLAVLLACVIVAIIWGHALLERIFTTL